MKIFQLISSKGFFGAENVLVQLVAELYKHANCTPVVGVIENVATPHREVLEACAGRGIKTAKFESRKKFDFNTIKTIRKYIISNKIDIVHSHGYKSNIYIFFATVGLPVKRVATCHNWVGNSLKMRVYSSLDKMFLRKFNYIVGVSDDVLFKIAKAGINNAKIKKINNGINVRPLKENKSKSNLKNSFGLGSDAVIIGSVGRISKEKGLQYLLAVASDIINQYPNTYFLIVGDGDLKEKFEKEYRSSHIIFAGLRKDVAELYLSMDMFVLPSLTEGLPMVLLEAMAAGLPVVSTKVGQIPAVVKDKESGLLVSPGSSSELKQALLSLLKNIDNAKMMGLFGYEEVKNKYSSSRMAEEYIKVYRELMNEEKMSYD